MYCRYMRIEEKEKLTSISKPKVCILGSYKGRKDEGMANVSYNLYESVKRNGFDTSLLDISEIWSVKFWKELKKIRPDILHLVPGPTLKGLVLAKILQKMINSKLIVSATKPVMPSYFSKISRFIRPDIVIVQSSKSEAIFKDVGYDTTFIPNGVDTDKFVPVSSVMKQELRTKYGFKKDDFIVLHVGPLKKGRNQEALLRINNVKVLLVTSITNPSENDLFELFDRKTNVTLWTTYIEDISEIYSMVDVYVFPVFKELNSIDIPLSVLEAMSCNLPVISSNYGGLANIVKEGEGFYYMYNEKQLLEICQEIKMGNVKINTRKKIEEYSWNTISQMISNLYKSLCCRED